MVSVLGQKNCAAVKTGGNTLARLAQNENANAPAVKREAEEEWGR
jgi:hypothetical protein